MEVGLLSLLKDRWLEKNIKQDYDDKIPQAIEIYQVSSVIAVICGGAMAALIILTIEKIVFAYKLKKL